MVEMQGLLPEGVSVIDGDYKDQNLLSMHQLTAGDIDYLLSESRAAEGLIRDPEVRGINLLPFTELKAVMRQPSTRTGGSMATAMAKLGGSVQVISGMESSSEGKGESPEDSWIAFATQADIIGARTHDDDGVATAIRGIKKGVEDGKLWSHVPVINLGNGRLEHPTQTLGDFGTIHSKFGRLEGLTTVLVGDHARYRSFGSYMIGAAIMNMKIIAVESEAARVPQTYVDLLGTRLERVAADELDAALAYADILHIGRNPDEYSGDSESERARSEQLAADYLSWIIDFDRLQQMNPKGMVLHPRPRRNELHPSIDSDPRAYDVPQMARMIPLRMAVLANLSGQSIQEALAA